MNTNEKKQRKITLKWLFRDATLKEKEKDNRPSISLLKKMATTKELRDVLKKIEYETIPTVKNAWIDYFLEVSRKPKYRKN